MDIPVLFSNPSLTINDVTRQYPQSLSVFNKHGIDFCCGGKKNFFKVCEEANVDAFSVIEEIAVAKVSKEYKENLGDKMKIAVVTSICPTSMTESIYQYIETTTTYPASKKKIKSLIENRIAMNLSKGPMDIGRIKTEEEEETYKYDQQ